MFTIEIGNKPNKYRKIHENNKRGIYLATRKSCVSTP